MQGAWVRSLLRELKSYMPHEEVKIKPLSEVFIFTPGVGVIALRICITYLQTGVNTH